MGKLQLFMSYGFYVYLMYQQGYSGKPEYSSNDLPNLSKLDNAFIVVFISVIIGIILRLWSFKALDEFFTFDLTIKKDHKLITHGPYRYLVHPSNEKRRSNDEKAFWKRMG
ncbi:8344_t:CDS:2 [Diversispora eburnea]|uniref:Protein-S-isoprenylcysteine O-methyltransferase n=1 Tax=Diversispora eburnea TaxID=1213867 RepID=A0A9N9CH78_9GLOM|nr:8344_t:CDS:2 [Diversispora eburnea]